jgi:predicted kinase
MTEQLVLRSGFPGVGKSTLGRAFSAATGAVHLEVDVAEATVDAMVAEIQTVLL